MFGVGLVQQFGFGADGIVDCFIVEDTQNDF